MEQGERSNRIGCRVKNQLGPLRAARASGMAIVFIPARASLTPASSSTLSIGVLLPSKGPDRQCLRLDVMLPDVTRCDGSPAGKGRATDHVFHVLGDDFLVTGRRFGLNKRHSSCRRCVLSVQWQVLCGWPCRSHNTVIANAANSFASLVSIQRAGKSAAPEVALSDCVGMFPPNVVSPDFSLAALQGVQQTGCHSTTADHANLHLFFPRPLMFI